MTCVVKDISEVDHNGRKNWTCATPMVLRMATMHACAEAIRNGHAADASSELYQKWRQHFLTASFQIYLQPLDHMHKFLQHSAQAEIAAQDASAALSTLGWILALSDHKISLQTRQGTTTSAASAAHDWDQSMRVACNNNQELGQNGVTESVMDM